LPLSAIDVVSPAFERMKQVLFKPFRLGQWLRLALVGFLAGEMGGNGGCSARFPFDIPSSIPSSRTDQFQAIPGGAGLLFVLGIVLLVVLAFVLGLVFLYISSRMRFVLFDSVIDGQCRIRHSWGRRGAPAFRYFIWQILFSLAGVLSLILLIGVPLLLAFAMGLLQNPREHILALVLGGLAVLFLFFAWLIVFILGTVLTKDFVVPQMALDGRTATEGWSRLWAMMKSEKGGYAGYIGMKLVLTFATAVILGIVSIIVILVLLIPVGGFGVITVLAGNSAGLTWNPVTIAIAIVAGAIVLVFLVLLLSLFSVPATIFFPAYSLYFFADRYPPLRALLYPPSAEPDLSTLSPQP